MTSIVRVPSGGGSLHPIPARSARNGRLRRSGALDAYPLEDIGAQRRNDDDRGCTFTRGQEMDASAADVDQMARWREAASVSRVSGQLVRGAGDVRGGDDG